MPTARVSGVSIDLHVELKKSVTLGTLLPKARGILAEMLGLASVPELTLHVSGTRERRDADSDALCNESSPLFLVSIIGEPETVALSVPGRYVAVVMGAQRTNLEYALGAALAVALAREVGTDIIDDDWRFFGDQEQVTPEDLLRRLRVSATDCDYRSAAEKLNGKLDVMWPLGLIGS